MTIPAVISYSAAYFSLIVAAAVLLRDRRSFAHRVFAGGMFLFAVEELFRGISYGAVLPSEIFYWQRRVIAVSSLLPAVWLGFSISYARINHESLLSRWKWVLWSVGLTPILLVVGFRRSLFGDAVYPGDPGQLYIPLQWPGKALEFCFLLVSVLILFNLERTVRSSIGRIRWQIKFMAVGVGVLFALRIYLVSQSLLFSTLNTGLGQINAVALLAANLLFAFSLCRGRSLDVDVYLSTATIHNSLTIIFVGLYLLAVGILAHFTRAYGPVQSLPVDAFIIFLSLTALAVLLLSNRLRRKVRLFVGHHFSRPIYDYRKAWMELTRRTTSLVNVHELCTAVSKTVSESLDVLSVTVWLLDDSQDRLTMAGSTAISGAYAKKLERAGKSASEVVRFLRQHPACIDFQVRDFSWPKEIMQAAPEFFPVYKLRYAIGLHAGGELVGVMTLNDDHVGKEPLSPEDILLLETLAAQLAASLLNLKLLERLRNAKEAEAFQAVSTFFVHDLKNLASRLSLTMRNLPANFDNYEFRSDALRVIATSVSNIDEMCDRLAMLKGNIELKVSECDLNRLVSATVNEFNGHLKAEVKQDLQQLPKVLLDAEQVHKVLTNLILNANEAVNGNGLIHITTSVDGGSVGFSVRDNGCGMSEEFIEKSLFRPFQTTKKRGLGIGLFHSKVIVEAHHGTFEVTSALGEGTEFRVMIPLATPKEIDANLVVVGAVHD